MTDFKELITALGIEKYPDELEGAYKTPAPVSICDISTAVRLEEEYALCGRYFEKIKSCAEALKSHTYLRLYGDLVASYMYGKNRSDVDRVTMPRIDEDSVLRFFPVLVLISILPGGIAKFRKRGFSDEEIYKALHGTFEARIGLSETITKKQGLDPAGFSWLRLYCVAEVFPAGIFNVTPRRLSDGILVLKSDTGDVRLVVTRGVYHRSGAVLGCAGYTDMNGSFEASFEQTDEYIIAHESKGSFISPEKTRFDKKKWSVILRDGDGLAGIHIPRGADISPEKVEEGFRLALRLTIERYPEFEAKAVYCASWMLDPRLSALVGEGSRLALFMSNFLKFPKKSDGSAVFTFVFSGRPESLDDLPEDTSLRRKVKALYKSGGFIHPFGGIVPKMIL